MPLRLPNGTYFREDEDDLPTHCCCCDPRRRLITVPQHDGFILKCPRSAQSFKVRYGSRIIYPGIYVAAH